MEKNPGGGEPYNTAVIIDPQGEMILKYRKLNPWVPVEPWKAGDLGLPVCVGPGGSKLAVCICHDGMFPEVAREVLIKVQMSWFVFLDIAHKLVNNGC